MKQGRLGLLIGGILLLVVAVAITGVALWKQHSDGTNGYIANKEMACELLTLSEAQGLLGASAKTGSATGIGDKETGSVLITNCSYVRQALKSDSSDAESISLMVFAAKSRKGADTNADYFKPEKLSGLEAVEGVGDRAYLDGFASRMYILKGDNYYIVSASKGLAGNADTARLKEVAALAGL